MNTEHIEDAQVMEITQVNKEQAIAKLDDFSNMPELLSYAQTLLNSKLLPTSLKTAEAVATVCITGKELGMGPMAALSNVVVISGRPSLGVHAIGALLRKAGAATQTLEDFVPVMGLEGTEQEGKVVDYRTTIRFMRPYRDRIIEEDVSFTWKDATKMGLTEKPTWKSMPKIMTWSRCLSIGARRCVPDALLGMFEVAEVADFSNQPYKVDEHGEVTLL